ncbi:hypothetical protein B0H19DRAFT_332619 [Mycena capillaripes]|nr:hypothetical protein B0H19DRAFT_332619 [Mycena capillaripes]
MIQAYILIFILFICLPVLHLSLSRYEWSRISIYAFLRTSTTSIRSISLSSYRDVSAYIADVAARSPHVSAPHEISFQLFALPLLYRLTQSSET